MRGFWILFFCCFGFTSANAQIHEIGVFLGGSNYIGDVGPTSYIAPNEYAYGLVYKWNRTPRHSWRISYMQSKITSRDKNSDMVSRQIRDYDFENNLKEISLGMEFNFFDFNLHELSRKLTHYIYSGISYVSYQELFIVNGDTKEDYGDGAFAIPMTLGIKSNIMDHLILGVEVGARYSLTDNLDGSNPKNKNLTTLKFGNTNSNDWYVFSGITLTYTFGNKPCYCAE